MKSISASDIPKQNWVDNWLPKTLRPYARLGRFDRPIGAWLLLFPCWWSLTLATQDWTNIGKIIWFFFLFGIGAMIMRAAGCCLNDIIDRNYDASIARTRDRPIASGTVSIKNGLIFMSILSILGLIILIQFNTFTVVTGIASLLIVLIYPYSKRYTNWPQIILGLAFNWGALLGWTAIHSKIEMPAILLYVGGIFWTLGYDTIYALQDKKDDYIVGVKSTARILEDNIRVWLCLFFALAILFFGLAGWFTALKWPFYIGVLCITFQASWQIIDLKPNDPSDCLYKFKSNQLFGWIFLCSVFLGQLL